ncbi:hypothetical protein [Synechococcus sp. CS-205]|uniref:hypothetical protein n=1 Tax=Synechococcus sp. CS-205 TaxID=2847984 RepID=UPI00223BF3DA|nr:hypothetical protein [Synechococcus sp. CS-205]MCT0247681.1 hypothetical protein [Synechococcus sp. CS-205]
MGQRPNCRSCNHCQAPEASISGSEQSWCQMRRLAIHPELAGDLWCHHWTPRPPRLPSVDPRVLTMPKPANRQLALTELLAAVS